MAQAEEFDFVAERNKRQGQAGPTEELDFIAARDIRKEVGGDISNVLADTFDPENYASAGLRFSIARGDTFAEKQLKLKKEHPDGELKFIGKSVVMDQGPESDWLIYRESPDDKWKLVNTPGFEPADISSAIAPSTEAVIGETLALTAANLIGSAKYTVPRVVAIQAYGAFLGEAFEQYLQTLNDTQLQTFTEALAEGGLEAGMSVIGGFASSPLVAASNVARGSGALTVGEQGIDALQAASRIGDEIGEKVRLTPGMTVNNPLVARQEAQAAVVIRAFKEAYTKIVGQLDTAVNNMVPVKVRLGAVQRSLKSFRDFSNNFIDRLRVRKTSATAGGLAAKQGRAEYELVSRKITDRLYAAAKNIEDPDFDVTGLVNLSSDLRVGMRGKLSAGAEDLIKQIEVVKAPKELSDGSFLSVTQQYRNIADDARKLALPPEGRVAGTAEGQANLLLKEINKMLDNPTNASPEFKRAWGAARNSSKIRHDTLDSALFIDIAKSQEPSDLLRYAAPGNMTKLRLMRDTIDPKYWRAFKNAFFADLLNDPATLAKRLDAFDDDTLRVLIPTQAERQAWFKVAEETKRIAAVGADKKAFEQIGNKEFVRAVIDDANPNTFFTIMRTINETNDVALRDTWRRGIIDWAWDDVLVMKKNHLEINRPKLESNIKWLENTRMMNILSSGQRALFDDVGKVVSSLERLADAGTSIRGMEIASGLPKEIATLNFTGPATMGFIQSYGIGHLYLSRPGRFILLGKGKTNSKGEALRVLGAALGRVGANTNYDLPSLALEEE
jgi:hypothetical protein